MSPGNCTQHFYVPNAAGVSPGCRRAATRCSAFIPSLQHGSPPLGGPPWSGPRRCVGCCSVGGRARENGSGDLLDHFENYPLALSWRGESGTPVTNKVHSECFRLRRVREVSLAEVRLQEGESLENALRRFKRKVQTEDIIKEVKRHSFYLKPGERKRVKQALARKRARKKFRKDQD